ncbi:MAG: D-alanyl-D-alanine carboxypeptidase [Bacilli bacterium]|nr:D-alanyl-D-alanine carboxypeptidase [Bacilli bacterium]
MKKIYLLFIMLLFIPKVSALKLSPNAKSSILMEASTGEIIYSYNENEKRAPASMTKMMSLILIMEEIEKGNLKWNEKIKVSENAASMGGSQIYLEAGEIMSVHDLVKGISMASANDAVVALAERISGSEEEFVKRMNSKSKELGLTNTNFKNATGLDEEGHYSSAKDMGLIAKELVKHKKVLEFSSTYEDYLRQNTNKKFWLVNTNKLIKTYPGMDGLKTGFTENALYCLTATATRNNMRLIGVVMGESDSKTRNSEMSEMLDYGFNMYKVSSLLKKGKVVGKYIDNKSSSISTKVITSEDINVLNKKGKSKRKITYDIKIVKKKLPIKKGDIVGRLIAKENGKKIFETDVVTSKKIKKANIIELYLRYIGEFIGGYYIFNSSN